MPVPFLKRLSLLHNAILSWIFLFPCWPQNSLYFIENESSIRSRIKGFQKGNGKRPLIWKSQPLIGMYWQTGTPKHIMYLLCHLTYQFLSSSPLDFQIVWFIFISLHHVTWVCFFFLLTGRAIIKEWRSKNLNRVEKIQWVKYIPSCSLQIYCPHNFKKTAFKILLNNGIRELWEKKHAKNHMCIISYLHSLMMKWTLIINVFVLPIKKLKLREVK